MPKKTKKIEQLSEELNSLSKEIKSLNDSAKIGARDVASVTKSLKNAKKVSKAAKAVGDKVTDGDVTRLKESISREKQLSKIVQNLSGSLKKSDVNAIAKTMTYGKELGKISTMLSGKIGAREVAAMNKALVNANEVKRIANSLARKLGPKELKILSNSAKYTKDKVAIDSPSALAGDKNVTTLIEKLNLLLASDKKREQFAIKKDTRFEELERKREKEVSETSVKKEADKEEGMDLISSLLLGAGGIAGLAYIFKDEISKKFDELNPFSGKGGGERPKGGGMLSQIADTIDRSFKNLEEYTGPETSVSARVLLGRFGSKAAGVAAGRILSGVNAAKDTYNAISDGKADEYGTGNVAAGLGAFLGGNEKDSKLMRMLDKAMLMGGTGALAGGATGPLAPIASPILATAGVIGGLYTGYKGPEESAKLVDSAIQTIDNIKEDIVADVGYGARLAVIDPIKKLYIQSQLSALQQQEDILEYRAGNPTWPFSPIEKDEADRIRELNKKQRDDLNAELLAISPEAKKQELKNIEDASKKRKEASVYEWREGFYGKTPQSKQTPMSEERLAYGSNDFYGNVYNTVYDAARAANLSNPNAIAQLGAAQSALETGYGKSLAGGNNYFGIKGSGTTLPTQEYINGQYVTQYDSFRNYANMQESARDYVNFLLTNKRYSSVISSETPEQAIFEQGRSGYATDPFYYEKLMNIYSKNSKINLMPNEGSSYFDYSSNPPKINAEEINKSGSFPTTIVVQNNGDQSTHYHNYGNSGGSTIPEGMMPLNIAPNVR